MKTKVLLLFSVILPLILRGQGQTTSQVQGIAKGKVTIFISCIEPKNKVDMTLMYLPIDISHNAGLQEKLNNFSIQTYKIPDIDFLKECIHERLFKGKKCSFFVTGKIGKKSFGGGWMEVIIYVKTEDHYREFTFEFIIPKGIPVSQRAVADTISNQLVKNYESYKDIFDKRPHQ